MTKEKIARINELYHKMKDTGLTEEEKAEQASLRREYIADYRAGFTGILDNTYIQRPDGTKTKLKQNDDQKKDGE